MMRKFLALFLALAIAVTMAACGGKDAPTGASKDGNSELEEGEVFKGDGVVDSVGDGETTEAVSSVETGRVESVEADVVAAEELLTDSMFVDGLKKLDMTMVISLAAKMYDDDSMPDILLDMDMDMNIVRSEGIEHSVGTVDIVMFGISDHFDDNSWKVDNGTGDGMFTQYDYDESTGTWLSTQVYDEDGISVDMNDAIVDESLIKSFDVELRGEEYVVHGIISSDDMPGVGDSAAELIGADAGIDLDCTYVLDARTKTLKSLVMTILDPVVDEESGMTVTEFYIGLTVNEQSASEALTLPVEVAGADSVDIRYYYKNAVIGDANVDDVARCRDGEKTMELEYLQFVYGEEVVGDNAGHDFDIPYDVAFATAVDGREFYGLSDSEWATLKYAWETYSFDGLKRALMEHPETDTDLFMVAALADVAVLRGGNNPDGLGVLEALQYGSLLSDAGFSVEDVSDFLDRCAD